MPSLRYGGKDGVALKLAVSTEYVAVRTRAGGALDTDFLSRTGIEAMEGLEPVFRLPGVGIEVHRVRATRGRTAARDRSREMLGAEPTIEFAGRVLTEPVANLPVLYTENLFVKLRDDYPESACRKLLERYELTIKRPVPWVPNGYFVATPEGAGLKCFEVAEQLLREPEVELCHPELVWEGRRRGLFPQQWHLHKTTIGDAEIDAHVDVEGAWAVTQGEGVTIAVIDDGFDLDHLELAVPGKIVFPRDQTMKTDNPRPLADNNHGTACAGVACAEGVRGASGVAPRARLLPVRLISGLGSQDEADAIVWAADNGADVISCSWGPKDGDWRRPEDPLHQVVHLLPDSTRLALEHATEKGRGGKGCVITWAAGNGNESVDNDGYASYERVIAVAACNELGRRSVYSDFGKAVFCAFPSNDFDPAVRTRGIWTIDRSGSVGYNVGLLKNGDRRGHFTNEFKGTSSACPGVAGVAALVLSAAPHLGWREVRDVLSHSCDKIDPENGKYDAQGHSHWYGHGRVNAARAVALATAPAPAPAAESPMLSASPTRTLLAAPRTVAAIARRIEVTLKLTTKAPRSWVRLDDYPLDLEDGIATIYLDRGETYVLSWWLCGPAGTSYVLEIDAGKLEIVGKFPVRERIAQGATKAAGNQTFSIR